MVEDNYWEGRQRFGAGAGAECSVRRRRSSSIYYVITLKRSDRGGLEMVNFDYVIST